MSITRTHNNISNQVLFKLKMLNKDTEKLLGNFTNASWFKMSAR